MNWTLRAGAMASVLALAACGLGAPAYPTFGETAYRIEGTTLSESGARIPTVIYRDGPKMRVETTLPGRGPATIVFDSATNAAYVLSAVANPAATTAPPATTTAPPAGAPPAATPGATPAPQSGATPAAPAAATPAPTNLGVAVRVADTEAPEPIEAPWAALGADGARSSGECNVAGEGGRLWSPRNASDQGVERTACITSDGIVLEVREGERLLFQATRVERGVQDPALFGVPPGYQVVDPQAVVENVGETMDQLDSVTGAPTTAPPATTPPATRQ